MKTTTKLSCLALFLAFSMASIAAEPKRILIVGATVGLRHLLIGHGEQMIRPLAENSGGEFTVIFMSADPDYPNYPAPRPPGGGFGGRQGRPGFSGSCV